MRAFILLLFAFWAPAAFAQAPVPMQQIASVTDNAKLTAMFNTDQAAREGDRIDWVKLSKEDEQRRQDLHRMLDTGEVRSGNDFFHAAMIFQHGQNPDDYLLAHVLAMDAVAQGNKQARWLSAATLDRYLLSIWQPQIFGTQFHGGVNPSPMTHDKVNQEIVSDSMRAATCVTSRADQQKVLETVNRGGSFGSTNLKDACH